VIQRTTSICRHATWTTLIGLTPHRTTTRTRNQCGRAVRRTTFVFRPSSFVVRYTPHTILPEQPPA
jgi:hypothetical protein